MNYRILIVDGDHKGRYFVSHDYDRYQTTTDVDKATVFKTVQDVWGIMVEILCRHNIGTKFVIGLD